MGYSECDDGNTQSNDGCSSTCMKELHYKCIRQESGVDKCSESVPPRFKLININNKQLYITFTEKIRLGNDMLSPELMESTLQSLFTLKLYYQIGQEMKPITFAVNLTNATGPLNTISSFCLNPDIKFSLNGNESFYCFINQSKMMSMGINIIDMADNQLTQATSSAGTYSEKYISQAMSSIANSTGESLSSATTVILVGSLAVSVIMSSSIGSVLFLVQYMQFSDFYMKSNIQLPVLFQTTISKFSIFSNVNLNMSFIPNVFDYDNFKRPFYLYKMKLLSPSLLNNMGKSLSLFVLIEVLYGILCLLDKRVPTKFMKVKSFIGSFKSGFICAMPIEIINDLILPMLYFSFVQIFNDKYVINLSILDFALASLGIASVGLYFSYIIFKTYDQTPAVADDSFSEMCFRDYQLLLGIRAKTYTIIINIIRLFYSIVLVSLYQFPIIQAALFVVINCTHAVLILIIRPFCKVKMNYNAIFNYVCFAIFTIIISANTVFPEYTSVWQEPFGYISVILFFIPIGQSFIIFGAEYYSSMVKGLIIKVKKCLRRRKQLRISRNKCK